MEFGTIDNTAALEAFGLADFKRVDSPGHEPGKTRRDIPEIDFAAKGALTRDIAKLKARTSDNSFLVKPVIGDPGSGKPHLLNGLNEFAEREGCFFAPTDLTVTTDFSAPVNSAAAYSQDIDGLGGRCQPPTRLTDDIPIEAGAGTLSIGSDGPPSLLRRNSRPPRRPRSRDFSEKTGCGRESTCPSLRRSSRSPPPT
ncbi:MAG: hypothetical protein LBQ79_12540 [Deltaproteobacteria bacterium]|jgi:hypothetical protein|nr:hypothetical protein [Deltaproteobacteria bacterium]